MEDNEVKVIALFVVIIIAILVAGTIIEIDNNKTKLLKNQLDELSIQIEKLTKENKELKEDKELIREMYDELKKTLNQPSRGSVLGRTENKITLQATAYTLRKEECGKSEEHPLYGITASGNKVEEWNTVAMDKSIPFGTKIYIPYFKDKPNKGIFTVQDRGGAIKQGKIDIYMKDLSEALEFGRRNLEAYILKGGD